MNDIEGLIQIEDSCHFISITMSIQYDQDDWW